MAKGINLEEFKNQLDTDAQKRCAAQEETIRNLIKQNKEQNIEINQLQNRCWALTRGVMCLVCRARDRCKAKK